MLKNAAEAAWSMNQARGLGGKGRDVCVAATHRHTLYGSDCGPTANK